MGDPHGRNSIDRRAFGEPDPAPPDDEPAHEHRGASWAPIDLGPYLRGEIKRPEPSIGWLRRDGLALLYPGKEHTIIGEMESGKSWLALACAASELTKGNQVVCVHFEEADPGDTIERLQALHVPDQTILERFRFVGPDEPVDQAALAVLLDPAPSLVIFDGVNEAMHLHGWLVNDTDGAAAYRRHLVKPCKARGAAVLSADHVVKDPDRRGRNALGSIHKGNGIDGSLIALENVEPFGRGSKGVSFVFVMKDRPGHLRRHGKASGLPGKTFIGTLLVDATFEEVDGLDLVFVEPKEATAEAVVTKAKARDQADEARMLRVAAEVAAAGQVPNLRKMRAASRMSKDRTDNALERLTLTGKLKEDRGKQATERVFTIPEAVPEQEPLGVAEDQTVQ